jgi:hypothetical protein
MHFLHAFDSTFTIALLALVAKRIVEAQMAGFMRA